MRRARPCEPGLGAPWAAAERLAALWEVWRKKMPLDYVQNHLCELCPARMTVSRPHNRVMQAHSAQDRATAARRTMQPAELALRKIWGR